MTRSILLAALAASWPALACAPVAPIGAPVSIEEEEAIIVWDAREKTQHFIRRASFKTQARDFGFLVPTPSVPKLAEADNAAFGEAARLTAPATVYTKMNCGPRPREQAKAAAVAPEPALKPPVTVLAEQKVAGYDAAVLEATDAAALNDWLKAHDYVSSPELVAWFAPYIANHWKITAFKISGGSGARVSPDAVRMSFATEQSYFPYREPSAKTKPEGARLLRVFFLATERTDGLLGGEAWQAKTVWANAISDSDRDGLLKLVKIDGVAGVQNAWLTEFEDRASPRPGKDEVFFQRASDQSTVKRPDNVVTTCEYTGTEPEGPSLPEVVMWSVVSILGVVAAFFGYRRFRRSK